MTSAVANSGSFDVAVIGAGPAGSAIARRLALRGARVALVERTRFEAPRMGESLAPAALPLLTALGLREEFFALKPMRSFGTRSCWGEETPAVHSHLMSPWGCGWHVDRASFDRMLAEGARNAGAKAFFGMSLAAFTSTRRGWQLVLHETGAEKKLSVSTSLLIDATGRTARCSTQLGAQRVLLDRLVAAFVRFDKADTDREGYVLVETAPEGWWYSAPLPGSSMIAMLMTDSDLCRNLKAASIDSWRALIRTTVLTQSRLTQAHECAAPMVCSAVSHRLQRSERCRPWLAVGDAALAVDPISGSGVVRALRTAEAGAVTISAMLERGSRAEIADYEKERDVECSRYLDERARYYGLESRWIEQPFWARRHGMRAALGRPHPQPALVESLAAVN